MKISVNRHQYGIGQGCFHTQRITVDGSTDPDDMFDFVYDCGSTEATTKPSEKTLEWAIEHYRPKRNIDDEDARQVVDALFVSHFHGDHINGLSQLTASKDIRRLYIPHYTPQQVLALLGICSEWMMSATLAEIGTFLVELDNLANGRDLFGKRTVYVLKGDDNFVPAPSGAPDDGPLAAPAPDFVSMPDSIGRHRIWRDTDSITIDSSENGPAWEIRSWCYKESFGLAAALATELAKIPRWPKGLFSHKPSPRAVKWIIDHRVEIHKKYLSVIGSLSTIPGILLKNPNLISMSIYSGPALQGKFTGSMQRTNYGKPRAITMRSLGARRFASLIVMQEAEDVLGWIGTGDALLGSSAVWHDFSGHYEWRLEELATILMPHHGSGGGYYNTRLLGSHSPLCVFSAAAFSKYHHPSQCIIADVLRANADYIVVNEHTRPSFDEHFSIDV